MPQFHKSVLALFRRWRSCIEHRKHLRVFVRLFPPVLRSRSHLAHATCCVSILLSVKWSHSRTFLGVSERRVSRRYDGLRLCRVYSKCSELACWFFLKLPEIRGRSELDEERTRGIAVRSGVGVLGWPWHCDGGGTWSARQSHPTRPPHLRRVLGPRWRLGLSRALLYSFL